MAVEFIKPGGLSGYKVVTRNEESFEWTHVAMPRKEYYELREDVRLAYADAERAEQDAKDKIAAAEKKAAEDMAALRKAAGEQIAEMRRAMEAAIEEADYVRGLNANLLRVAKERANADRDIKPKKERSGFIVLRSKTKTVKYKSGKEWYEAHLWETTIQTPFTVDFTEEQARKESKKLYAAYDASGEWLIAKIGITADFGGKYEDLIVDDEWKADLPVYNIATETNWVANFQTGFWEMSVEHTKPLGIVPEDMRPEPKGKKKDKGPKEMKQPKNNKVIPKITDEEEV